MSDIVKIAVKTALILVITAAILAIFANLHIPSLDFTYFSQGISRALAIMYHWIPGASVIVPIAFTMLGIQVAILTFELAMIAVRWIMKVNE